MPIEEILLKDAPSTLEQCPNCGDTPFRHHVRGYHQRAKRVWYTLWIKKQPYCMVVCKNCRVNIEWEEPPHVE